MFVHGPEGTDGQVNLFLRIGRGDMTEYYEAVTPVYSGWDEKTILKLFFMK